MYSCSLALVESASHADLYLWICICVFVFVYFVFVYLCICVFLYFCILYLCIWESSLNYCSPTLCLSQRVMQLVCRLLLHLAPFPIQVNFKYFNLTWFVFYLDTFLHLLGRNKHNSIYWIHSADLDPGNFDVILSIEDSITLFKWSWFTFLAACFKH